MNIELQNRRSQMIKIEVRNRKATRCNRAVAVKKRLLVVFLSICFLCNAQWKDEYIINLISENRWFELVEQQHLIGKCYQEEIQFLAKGLVGFHTNNPQKSNYYFKRLLSEHQQWIAGQLYSFVVMIAINYMRLKQ